MTKTHALLLYTTVCLRKLADQERLVGGDSRCFETEAYELKSHSTNLIRLRPWAPESLKESQPNNGRLLQRNTGPSCFLQVILHSEILDTERWKQQRLFFDGYRAQLPRGTPFISTRNRGCKLPIWDHSSWLKKPSPWWYDGVHSTHVPAQPQRVLEDLELQGLGRRLPLQIREASSTTSEPNGSDVGMRTLANR